VAFIAARRAKPLEEILSTGDLDKKLQSRLHASPAPPAGFDPRKAFNRMLEKRGFPHRPDPKALRIVDLPGRVRPLRRNRKETDSTTNNWSGAGNVPAERHVTNG
jgi:hypothetical protein